MTTVEELLQHVQEALQEEPGNQYLVACGREKDVAEVTERLKGTGVGVEFVAMPCRFSLGMVYTDSQFLAAHTDLYSHN